VDVSQEARSLAELMAWRYLTALGFDLELGDPVAEPIVQLVLPAAAVAADTWVMAVELSARTDALAGALAARALRDAEERGDLDGALFPDVELPPAYAEALDWDGLLGRRAGDA
jgi:hypothetical protein